MATQISGSGVITAPSLNLNGSIIDSSGIQLKANNPAFIGTWSAGWNIISADAVLPFSNSPAPLNVGNCYDPGTSKFTAPVAGLYFFYANIYYAQNTTCSVTFKKNGGYFYYAGDIVVFYGNSVSGTDNSVQPHISIYLQANEYVTMVARNTQTSNIYFNHSYWGGHLIG